MARDGPVVVADGREDVVNRGRELGGTGYEGRELGAALLGATLLGAMLGGDGEPLGGAAMTGGGGVDGLGI